MTRILVFLPLGITCPPGTSIDTPHVCPMLRIRGLSPVFLIIKSWVTVFPCGILPAQNSLGEMTACGAADAMLDKANSKGTKKEPIARPILENIHLPP